MESKDLMQQLAVKLAEDKGFRRIFVEKFGLIGFCITYLPHYMKLESADFHGELIGLLSDHAIKFLCIAGFRGSAKSTYGGVALPLYTALEQKAKFILPINETDDIAKLTISNIRTEIESNPMIFEDYGELKGKEKFTETNMILANGVRIMSRSRGQKIRGLRHREHRPDLVVIDDPEELERVQKKEYRDKTESWIRSSIIPAIEETHARLIVIGNILHTDSLMARLRNDPIFKYREYPLVTKEGIVTWRGKYPTNKSLQMQEQKVGRTAWLREYLLKVVPPDGQEVKEEWIQYYDRLPRQEDIVSGGVGVDLAISKKETADFTSMVSGIGSIQEGMPKIYIMPNPVNQRLSFHETINQMKSVSLGMEMYVIPQFFVEDVAYQKAAIQEGQRHMLPIKAIKPGVDKRARLRAAATYIQNGTVLFPKTGCEDLITQMLGFGVEDHDDLVDALVYLILGISQEGIQNQEVISIL